MAALVRRALSSLIPLVIRSPGFSSSLIPATRSLGCSSSVLHLHNRLFASSSQPFSASPASIGHAEFHKTGNLTLHWESNDEIIVIKVTEKVHFHHSKGDAEEPSLQMHIKFPYGDNFSNCLEFDVALPDDQTNDEVIEIQVEENIYGNGYSKVDAETRSLHMDINICYGDKFCKSMRFDAALPDDQGSVAIKNVTMRVDTWNRIGEHFGEFTGLLEKRGLNSSNLDDVVQYADKLKQVMS